MKPASFRRLTVRCLSSVILAMAPSRSFGLAAASARAFALNCAAVRMVELPSGEALRMTTLLYSHPSSAAHDPGPGHPESPARIRAILTLLEREERKGALMGVHREE